MIYPNELQSAEAVAKHYNDLDKYYLKFWGEHLHHGLWDGDTKTIIQATENLIEAVAQAGQIKPRTKVCDVGCGYGATSRCLAKKKGADVMAITVSKEQWQHARVVDAESVNPRYILGDFLHNDFPDNSFDVVISIESSEHMVEKEKFFKEAFRILKPGGRFVTCAWLSKEEPKQWEVKYLLEPICREGRLPSMGSESDYRKMMEEAGFENVQADDLSHKVKKTWAICCYRVAKAALGDKALRRFLLDKNASERIFAKTLFRLWAAYNTGSMRYLLMNGIKPRARAV